MKNLKQAADELKDKINECKFKLFNFTISVSED